MSFSSARTQAIQIAKQHLARDPIYLDTETTGFRNSDEIVEIAIIDSDGSTLVDTLAKPMGKIPADANRIHGITNEMVENAPSWKDVWEEVETALQGRLVAIYNADFDLRLMRQTHQRNWMNWRQPTGTEFFCLMKLYAQYHGQWNARRRSYRWQSLDAAGKQCGIPLPNAHRAKDDTILTHAILHHIASI